MSDYNALSGYNEYQRQQQEVRKLLEYREKQRSEERMIGILLAVAVMVMMTGAYLLRIPR